MDFIDTRFVFIGGKGGVGKTTLSASIALKLAKKGKKTLIISTDPAHSLGDALDKKLNSNVVKINDFLDAQELNPKKITDEHFKNIEDTLRGYAKPEMFNKIKEHLELSKSSPGASEAALLEAICKILVEDNEYDHVVFDTAPTGHTIRLLSMPSIMSAWTDGLMARQTNKENLKDAAKQFWKGTKSDKNPFSPTLQNRWDRAYEKLNERKELFKKANEVLKNAASCKVFLVLIPQMLPLQETKRALEQLEAFKIKCGGIFVNQIIPQNQKDEFWRQQSVKQDKILQDLQSLNVKKVFIKLSSQDLRGDTQLENIQFIPNWQ